MTGLTALAACMSARMSAKVSEQQARILHAAPYALPQLPSIMRHYDLPLKHEYVYVMAVDRFLQ